MTHPSTSTAPRILPAGDAALVVEFGDAISVELHDRVIALDQALQAEGVLGVTETVPTYRSLLVLYDPGVIRGAVLAETLAIMAQKAGGRMQGTRLWHVPVLYGHDAGLDLDEMAEMNGMTTEALIALHGSVDYRVYMIGFAPGFTYLGGLPETLHTPRLTTPRQLTSAGGIAIGGAQACIGALPSPSGWRFLGRTPLRSFDPAREEVFAFRPGDMIRFHPVTENEATALDARSAKGEICADYEVAG
ncbi:5-oxoprolinase subunit PxpB [Falsirhodobacter xinxiangensis]|uniref:5-oxoprolinase subunit PxpB n=1 Tax=Falsirhodobacter xinxiangensis TaxID=2530049 RepID=UPI0010AA85F1|nr:5-oxoprolinase subunit PxpB [Rhodobacter xinxiangensis]